MWRPPRARHGWRTWTALHIAYAGRWIVHRSWLPAVVGLWFEAFALWLAGLESS